MNRPYQIGVLMGNAHTRHVVDVIRGIYDAAREENIQVTLFMGAQGRAEEFSALSGEITNTYFKYQYNALYDYATLGQLDALVLSRGTLCANFTEEEMEELLNKFSHLPIVILEQFDGHTERSHFMSDNYESMRQIVEHLVTVHRYKKIVFLGGPENNMDADRRKQAYLDVLSMNGLYTDESMVRYGDFTVNVEDVAKDLLENNPDAQALVAANDEMAMAAINVARKMGKVIGKDIAITGYDDIDGAVNLDPPLTTANQDGMDIGYRAIKMALDMCKGGKPESVLLPAELKIRGSCGCEYLYKGGAKYLLEIYENIQSSKDDETIKKCSEWIIKEARLSKNGYAKEVAKCQEGCESLINLIIRIRDEEYISINPKDIENAVLRELRRFLGKNYSYYFNIGSARHSVEKIIQFELDRVRSTYAQRTLQRVGDVIGQYIDATIQQNHAETVEKLVTSKWMIPSAIQNMMESGNDEMEVADKALKLIRDHGVDTAFLYINDEPIRCRKGEKNVVPSHMYLIGSMNNGIIKAYEDYENNTVDLERGFTTNYPKSNSKKQYGAFLLFQQELQYGLAVCEIEDTQVDDMFCVALEISTAMAFMHISKEERRTKEMLYKTLQELEEKNRVLAVTSNTDELTHMYNRRGFMEQIIELLHSNKNGRACLLFFDLDHLKQINDILGHN